MCGRDVLYAVQTPDFLVLATLASRVVRTKEANPLVAVKAVRLSCFLRILYGRSRQRR